MKLLLISMLIVELATCFNKNYNDGMNVSSANDKQFKSWLKDTLETSSLNQVDYSREINVSKDSLFFDIKSYYKLKLSQRYKGENKDLAYAIDLLERSGSILKDDFILELEIHHYYGPSMVPQLVYDFDNEISKLLVEYCDSSFVYRFIKGNLIDKKSSLEKNP